MNYDLFVIGGGSGGVRASRLAAAQEKKVGIAEEYRLGGTCVIRGCVPKKLMSFAASLSYDFKDSYGLGWNEFSTPSLNWQKLRDSIQQEVTRLENIYGNILQGVTVYKEHAKIIAPNTILVGKEMITADKIIIATGGKPSLPSIAGIEYAMTSNECFTLEELPKSLVVYGGGFIAVEFASIFNAYGVDVTLVYRGDKVLRGFDTDLRQKLTDALRIQGINVILNESVKAVKKQGDNLSVELENSSSIIVDKILFATGRSANTANLGLEELGVKLAKNGRVITDDFFETNVKGIYAVGDVSNHINLTPVAINEAIHLVKTLFGKGKSSMDYTNIAFAVFTYPPIGSVGLSEDDARNKGYELEVYTSEFKPLKNNLSNNPHKSFMKMLVDAKTQKVLGLHMLGIDAPEIIQGFAVAIKMEATKADFDATVGVHPTAAEEFVTMR